MRPNKPYLKVFSVLYFLLLICCTRDVLSDTINPTGRTLSLQTPLVLNGSVIGSLLTEIDPDDTISFDATSFINLLEQYISNTTKAELIRITEANGTIRAKGLTSIGVDAEFDLGLLSVSVMFPTSMLGTQNLHFDEIDGRELGVAKPVSVSGYLNFSALASNTIFEQSEEGISATSGSLDSEIRLGDPVVAFGFDFVNDPDSNTSVKPVRRYTRIGLDISSQESVVEFVDVSTPSGGLSTSSTILGGSIGRNFALAPNRNVSPTGQQRFSLNRKSTVTIVADGLEVRNYRLPAGNYNLSDIPLASGYNELSLVIEDDAGRVEEIDFSTFFSPRLLAPGVLDYRVSAGVHAKAGVSNPIYLTDEPAAGVFLRYGATPTLTLAHTLQLNKTQIIAESDALLATRFGSWQGAAALSKVKDREVSWVVNTQFQSAPASRAGFQWSAGVEFRGAGYKSSLLTAAVLAAQDTDEPASPLVDTVAGFVGVSGRFSDSVRWNARINNAQQDGESRRSLNVSIVGRTRRLSWTLRGQHEKPIGGPVSNGVSIALSYQVSPMFQIGSTYNSLLSSMTITGNKKVKSGLVGGYDLQWSTAIDGSDRIGNTVGVGYTGNRYTSELRHRVQSGIDENSRRNVTTAKLNSSLVFAGKSIALSRTVTDSFAIIDKHETLGARRVRIAPSGKGEIARTDWMGKAVIPDLGLYKPRSINYDVDDLPIGYSLDEGAFFVKPPRGAGYRFTVGSDAVITVVGVLLDESSGEPLSLLSGSAQSESDPEKSPIVFFTNRAGKFALSGVASGKYRIELNDEPKRQFTLVIPDDSPTWYRPGKINVP